MAKKRSPSSKRLFQAVEEGDLETLQEEVQRGVNVNAFRRDDGYTPLGLAVENGNVEVARALLRAGAESRGGGIVPILKAAIESRSETMVQLLIEFGADVNSLDEDRLTPLMHAAQTGNVALVDQLLAAGADAGYCEQDGEAAIVWAAHAGHEQVLERLRPLSPPAQVQRALEVPAGYVAQTARHGPVCGETARTGGVGRCGRTTERGRTGCGRQCAGFGR